MIIRIIRTIFDWSEVWALLIPLAILFIYKPSNKWVTPVKWYLLIALFLNLCIDFIWYANKKEWFGLRHPDHLWNNNVYYNIQSIVRLLFFSWFFSTQGKGFQTITRVIPAFFLLAVLIFFTSFKSIRFISSYLLASESGLLLIYCLWYTNKIMRDDKPSFSISHPPYWVAGGLTLYTAVNFFIFLFYNYLMKNYKQYSVGVWDIHNILFIILCVCISIAFYYEPARK